MATLQEYLDLITTEHSDKPKFMATVALSLAPLVAMQNLFENMFLDFDLDVAVGAQLDILGLWIGVSRNVRVPITGVYFAWDDTAMVGWDSGVWQGEFDPDTGLTSLNDVNYRTLLRARIARNHWDGSIPDAYKIWAIIFPDDIIFIQDNQNMSMSIGVISTSFDAVDVALLTGGYLSLKPEGVRIADYFISPGPMFGWDSEGGSLAGWDEGLWATELTPT